jgi:dipeptidyl aminopeptidase/acylaminoacyl peptidase
MEAHRRRRTTQSRLLVVVLGLVWVVAACGGTSAPPTATSGVAVPPTSNAASSGEVTALFDYARRQPLATTAQQSREEAGGITVASITYASPKGGEVPALVVLPPGRGPFPGVIVQHGMPDTKEGMLPTGIDLTFGHAVLTERE